MGFGFYKKVDLKKIIPDENLSINRGSNYIIEGQNSNWFKKQIEVIGKKFNFDLNTPINEINKSGMNVFYMD